MAETNQVPLLIQLYFGEAAAAAWQDASPRLKLWAQAFEQWLEQRRRQYSEQAAIKAWQAFQRLIRQNGKMLWELQQQDIEQHVAWLQAQGYALRTIANSIAMIDGFFQWLCSGEGRPLINEPILNPAAGMRRPRVHRYAGVRLLSRVEVQRLLELLARDVSPIGRRDYALVLARLRLGVPSKALQHLTMGQVSAGLAGQPIPAEVQKAIQEYLQASGRLAGMHVTFAFPAQYCHPLEIRLRRQPARNEGLPGQPLSREDYQAQVDEVAEIAGRSAR